MSGDTRLQDSFGTISVTGLAAADVVASNNSGDISLTFTQVPRRITVTDSFGNITLVLPSGTTAYRVQTRDSFGTTKVTVPQSPTARNVITASNNSGDITIVTVSTPPRRASLLHRASCRTVRRARALSGSGSWADPGPGQSGVLRRSGQGTVTSRVAWTARRTMRAYT